MCIILSYMYLNSNSCAHLHVVLLASSANFDGQMPNHGYTGNTRQHHKSILFGEHNHPDRPERGKITVAHKTQSERWHNNTKNISENTYTHKVLQSHTKSQSHKKTGKSKKEQSHKNWRRSKKHCTLKKTKQSLKITDTQYFRLRVAHIHFLSIAGGARCLAQQRSETPVLFSCMSRINSHSSCECNTSLSHRSVP